MFFKEIRVKRFLRKEANKISLPSNNVTETKRRTSVRLSIASAACVLVIVFPILVVRYVNSKTEHSDIHYFPNTDSTLTNKYEAFCFAATSYNLREFDFALFPEIQDQPIKKISISYSGKNINVFYDNYHVAITKNQNIDPSRYDLDILYESKKKYFRKVEIVEKDGMRYLITNNRSIFYVKDGFGISISLSKPPEDNSYILDALKYIKFVDYEFIGDGLARGKVYDDMKILKYNFEGKDIELTYKYSEINYRLCVEYDVYTDGTNDFMFDKNNTLVGFRINNLKIKLEELSKYIDTSKFKLKKKKDRYHEYRQYVNGLKTNGFAYVKLGKNGNITELLVNEVKIEGDIPNISDRLLKKEIKNKLVSIIIKNKHQLKLDKVEQMRYSVDESGELVVICDVKVKVKTYKLINFGAKRLSIIIVIKVNDCIK